jgi:Carboxypeptidase regulatory-like domain
MRSAFKHARTTAVLLTLVSGLWAADERSTHLVVKVIDQSTAPIARAEIRIDRSTDSVHPVLLADANGLFAVDLRPGTYDLEVRSPGFRSYKKPLDVGQSREQFVTITLAVGGCSPCVTVTAGPSGAEPAVPLSSPSYSSLPAACRSQADLRTGIPVFFSAEKGVRYGVSVETNHFFKSSPVPVHVWIDNATDKAIEPGSCSMFQDRGIDVWSNSEQRMLKRQDFEAGGPQSEASQCSADIKISVPAHDCATASLLYLNDIYNLAPGVYTVVERVHGKSTPPQKEGIDGLSFQMRDAW